MEKEQILSSYKIAGQCKWHAVQQFKDGMFQKTWNPQKIPQ